MIRKPAWLPSQIEYDGDWHLFLNVSYAVFERDLKRYPKVMYHDHIVFIDKRLLDSDREEGFWHLISRKDQETGERLPDIERARKITWVRPIIEHFWADEVVEFDKDEGRRGVRSYLWLRDYDYVVILQKKRQRKSKIAFLITGYHVDRSYRRSLERKYRNRL